MIARWAIAPLHHPLNRHAVTGGALRRVLVGRVAAIVGLNVQDKVSHRSLAVDGLVFPGLAFAVLFHNPFHGI